MAVAYWSEYLKRDMSREEDKRMEELMELEYAKFEESLFGRKLPSPNFFDNY
jgi:hypothetical protein